MRRALVVALLCVAAAITTAAPARAAGNGEWSIDPTGSPGAGERTFFSYDVRPGDRLTDRVTLRNLGDAPITLELASADAYNTANDGGFALRAPDDGPPTDLGAWVRLPVDRWTIPARSQTELEFEIAVPTDARPGDHAGGILTLAALDTAAPTSGVAVRRGVGVRIYAHVAGDSESSIAVDELRTSHGTPIAPFVGADATVSFRITNTGDTLVAPAVRVEARTPFGTVHEADLGTTQELLPGGSVVLSHRWTGVPAGGPVTQRVIVEANEMRVIRTARFWVAPWWLLALAVVIVVAFVAVRRRRNHARRATHAIAGSAVVMLVLAAAFASAAPAFAAAAPQIDLSATDVGIGEVVHVSGRNWPPRTNVAVELCGDLARSGSTDCDLAGSAIASVGPDGRFLTSLVAGKLPAPCPCVVRARAVTGNTRVVAGIHVSGLHYASGSQSTTTSSTPTIVPVAQAGDSPATSRRSLAIGVVAAGSLALGAFGGARHLRHRAQSRRDRRRAMPTVPVERSVALSPQPASSPQRTRRARGWVCAQPFPSQPRRREEDRGQTRQSSRWHRA